MRTRTLHTSVNLLIEPVMYQRLKMSSRLEKASMSKIIRDGIRLILAEIDKKNNTVIGG
jgi:hypothetical protein